MAQDGDEDEEGLEFEDVAVDDSNTPSTISAAQTPIATATSKRSREESDRVESAHKKAKADRGEQANGAGDDDDEGLELEDAA